MLNNMVIIKNIISEFDRFLSYSFMQFYIFSKIY